jgi:hypothetical protein
MDDLTHKKHLLQYIELLEKVQKYKQPKREKTVFSIGGRGHYENPISDVLSFFLHPSEEHQFESLFLFSFLKTMNLDPDVYLANSSVERIEREVITPSGNRIDLAVVAEDWVLVIENKIYHHLANPLEDYVAYVKDHYPKKKQLFAILSINQLTIIPEKWENIVYSSFINEVKKNAGPYLFNGKLTKWSFFLQDFILNIEDLIGELIVDHEMMDFVQKNYEKILGLLEVKDHYINSLRKTFSTFLDEVADTKVEEKIHNWSGKRTAIRFYCPDAWGKQTNLVLVLLPEGKFKVFYYVYGIEAKQQEKENVKLLYKDYQSSKEHNDSILCYKSTKSYSLSEVEVEFKAVSQHLHQYFN